MPFSPTLFHPERYHGHNRRPPFFEGWYFKLVDASETHRYAVIPGIFLSEDPDRHHAFVQILNGSTGEATYHCYPADEFRAADDRFEVEIGPNRFSNREVVLDINDSSRVARGTVHLGTPVPWPVTPTRLGIMGPYGWAPFMECNHGLVSFDHSLEGTLSIDGGDVDFSAGRGYTEKDWGKAFPAGYVWMQTNHFETPGTSFVASIAIIPWMISAFPRFHHRSAPSGQAAPVRHLHPGPHHRSRLYRRNRRMDGRRPETSAAHPGRTGPRGTPLRPYPPGDE